MFFPKHNFFKTNFQIFSENPYFTQNLYFPEILIPSDVDGRYPPEWVAILASFQQVPLMLDRRFSTPSPTHSKDNTVCSFVNTGNGFIQTSEDFDCDHSPADALRLYDGYPIASVRVSFVSDRGNIFVHFPSVI